MSYAPRPGSLTAKAVERLRDEGPLADAVLADRLDSDKGTLATSLVTALDRGFVKRERHPTTGLLTYSLGDGVPLHVGVDGYPVQRTVAANDVSPGVDIDRVHRNSLWPSPQLKMFAMSDDGRLCISKGSRLFLDAEETQALRRFLAEAA